MVRKKQFINKKTAQHFHVVHRSQRDPKANDPDASKYVLLSANRQVELASDDEDDDEEYSDEAGEEDEDASDDEMPDLVDSPRSQDGAAPQSFEEAVKTAHKQTKKTSVKPKKAVGFATRRVRFGSIEAEDLVDENGMVRDGYDYTQHLKEMGKGRFYSANGEFASQMDLARRVDLPSDVLPSADEQDRLLDAITLTTETMDADLREALLNDEAFEEMDDDFVLQAAVEDPDADTGNDGFDYDAHIAKLMAAASGVPKFRGDLTDDEEEDDEEEHDDDDDCGDEDDDEYADLDGYAGADRSEKQRVLDEAFEKMLAEEYDDDQLGELEDDDPETRGDVVLEGELLASIVEDFVIVRQEMLNDEGKLGNPLRTGNRLQEIIEECEKERLADEGEDGETEEEDPLAVEEDARATEQQLRTMFERNAYLAPREEEQWDCETIVSTYSTLDNHPTLLREDGLLKKKKKKKAAHMSALDEQALADAARNKSQIVLSRKTGMPLGVFETDASTKKDKSHDAKASAVVVTAPKIKREESKEDKKARKEAAKQQKQQRRQEKKQWKTAFKEEEQRQLTLTQPGKVSVFKYT